MSTHREQPRGQQLQTNCAEDVARGSSRTKPLAASICVTHCHHPHYRRIQWLPRFARGRITLYIRARLSSAHICEGGFFLLLVVVTVEEVNHFIVAAESRDCRVLLLALQFFCLGIFICGIYSGAFLAEWIEGQGTFMLELMYNYILELMV